MDDKCVVLFPGAAHASITVDFCFGLRRKAGRQLALKKEEIFLNLPAEYIISLKIRNL